MWPGPGLAGVVAVCAVSFGAAAALAAIVVDRDDEARQELVRQEGQPKDWRLVGQTTDSRFGPVEFYRAEVAGSQCLGYRLVDQDRPYGTRTIYQSCDDATTLEVGWLRKEGGRGPTLAHGWVSDEIASVVLRVPGKAPRELPLQSADGAPGRFFASSDAGPLRNATVEARAKDGSKKAERTSAP